MLRNVLSATVAFAALTTGSAFAADLPSRAAPAPYFAPAPVFTWTGFYVGANAGVGFNSNGNGNAATPTGFTAAASPAALVFNNNFGGHKSGFTGGLTLGYNIQYGALVIGTEADFNYIDRDRRGNGAAPVLAPATVAAGVPFAIVGGSSGDRSNFFGTIRARVGYAADRALFFVTGGFAYANGSNANAGIVTYYANGAGIAAGAVLPPGSAFYSRTTNHNNNYGYTLGAGLEYAFTNNWTTKLEYDYVDLGGRRGGGTFLPFAGAVPAPLAPATTTAFQSTRRASDFSRVVVGVNYKF